MDQDDEKPAASGPPLPDIVKSGPPPPSPPPLTPGPPPPPSFGAPVITPPPLAGLPPDVEVSEEEIDVIPPFNTRLIAAVIDGVVALGLHIAIAIFLPSMIGYIVATAYIVTRDGLPFLGGQSVGKKAMRLKAVTLDGRSLAGNWEPALIRGAVLAIPLFALVELFILLSREEKPERGRRLGDEWAKTKVIMVNEPVV